MALTAHCPVCDRTVYVEDGATPICPVCSTPLLEVAEVPDESKDPSESR